MESIEIRVFDTLIEVYFRDKIILEVADKEYAIEVYDFSNDVTVPVTSSWLRGAFEEVEPYLNMLLDVLERMPNDMEDLRRKEELENFLEKWLKKQSS